VIEFPDHGEQGRGISIDRSHAALIYGIIVAQKPSVVIELGMGVGYSTKIIMDAVRYNTMGEFYCVDNWMQYGGLEPPWAEGLRQAGVQIIAPIDEEQYVTSCQDNFCDLLFSDADHDRSHEWLHHHLRITKPNGFLFFHDTAGPDYPGLKTLEGRMQHLPTYHFRRSTRQDEWCERGMLMVINRK